MNIQAMLKQAQKMQKEMMEEKTKLDSEEFIEENSNLKIIMTGDKKLKSIKIKIENIQQDELEMLEDMILVAINKLNDTIDREIENKMGKYTKGMPGLF